LKEGRIRGVLVFYKNKFDGEYKYVEDKYVIDRDFTAAAEDLEKQKMADNSGRTLWICDDTTGAINWSADVYSRIFTNFRHLNIDMIINGHYVNKLDTLPRDSATHVAMFEQKSKRSINGLWEAYGPHYDDYKEFKSMLMKSCNKKEHKFLWYTVSPEGDQSFYQPMIAPENIPQFFVQVSEVKEKPKKKKQKKE
jgi:hypothetical protein